MDIDALLLVLEHITKETIRWHTLNRRCIFEGCWQCLVDVN